MGGVTSGAEKAKAAAALAALVLPLEVPTPVPVVPPLPPLPSSAASPAAADPQFPLTLQARVDALQVFSDGPQGSYTDNVRTAVAV